MTKNELKDLIKECLQEAATSENFITFRISGGYNFKTKPPTESKFILTIGSTEDLIELLSQTDNMQIMQLASELKKHIP
jgi:hypothetical protein